MAWLRVMASPSSSVRALGDLLVSQGLREGDPASRTEPGVVVIDRQLPEVRDILAGSTDRRVLVALSPATSADPWQLLREGASDVTALASAQDVATIRARIERWSAVEALLESPDVTAMAVGESGRWKAFLREVVEIARFTASPVLLTGETGTGKEVVARLIDRLDSRPDKPDLQLVDCATVVPTLLGSELFGHEKGAFTGATSAKDGAFALAHKGTLFLDEVGELPLALQPALLRVVQEGTYKAVGSVRWRSARFRLLAATNRDLRGEADEGRFRRDLYYRLAAVTVRVPPLRERPEDVVPLFSAFLAGMVPGGVAPALTAEVSSMLAERDYPGNVRDLRQLATRVFSRHVGPGPITVGDIPLDDRPTSSVRVAGAPEQAQPVSGSGVAKDREAGRPGTAVDAQPAAEAWREVLERAVRAALGDGVGLREIKEAAANLATDVALATAGGASGAARILGVSRRAVDYRSGGRLSSDGRRHSDTSEASS